jgi:small-conductance mechanosensitive channel
MLIIVALLVAYSSNLGYMVTILGFASAGIAISLKDWFLSILGWMVILTTGQIRAGNRIKVIGKDGEVAGDILDVSLMKITIYEDVSLLSYQKDERAGRIIFIPNSYIFTHIFLNYNHSGMQTIWDSVYVALSFDSDLDKAVEIAKDIAQKHSKAVTRLADMQMNRLRANYNIPKYGTTPRVFTFLDNGCVVLHVWFLCNYFTPMVTKSAVTRELIKALQEAENITMIYTPHTVMFHNQKTPPQPKE